MAHNFHNVGFACALAEVEWFQLEAGRAVQGLPTTPTLAEAEASGTLPSFLVEFVKQRQQQLRDAYHAEVDARRRALAVAQVEREAGAVRHKPPSR